MPESLRRDEWDRLLSGDRAGLTRNRCNAAAYRLMLGDVRKAHVAALEALQLSRRGNSVRDDFVENPVSPASRDGRSDGRRNRPGGATKRLRRCLVFEAKPSCAIRQPSARTAFWSSPWRAGSGRDEIDRFAAEGAVLDVDGALDLALATGSALAARAQIPRAN